MTFCADMLVVMCDCYVMVAINVWFDIRFDESLLSALTSVHVPTVPLSVLYVIATPGTFILPMLLLTLFLEEFLLVVLDSDIVTIKKFSS